MLNYLHRIPPSTICTFRGRTAPGMKSIFPFLSLAALAVCCLLVPQMHAQDWVKTGTNLGNARFRLAAADFKPVGADPETPALKATFDATLLGDLSNAGIFDLVSKSMLPQATPEIGRASCRERV